MATSILYVGVDVDDKAFHIAGFDSQTNKYYEHKCKPTVGALEQKLELFVEKGFIVHLCYEATYIGYSLCRILRSQGYVCDIIAPSLIPTQSSACVKTDRVDSRKLALYYAKGLLTPISIPDETDEQLRRLIRSRSFEVKSRKKLKLHILSNCRQLSIHYREGANSECNYWTKKHLLWLHSQIKNLDEMDHWLLESQLSNLLHSTQMITHFDQKIQDISETERYRLRCLTLNSFKGLSTLSSMTLIAELGDIRRFDHPKRIVSYAGMDIREYSSGGKEQKFGITKMGNKHIRTTVVEACQTISAGSTVGKQLRKRRNSVPPEILAIAEKCQERLYRKKMKLQFKGKQSNKITVIP